MEAVLLKTLNLVGTWGELGQWLFFLACLFAPVALLGTVCYHGAVILRGWPPPAPPAAEWEEEGLDDEETPARKNKGKS